MRRILPLLCCLFYLHCFSQDFKIDTTVQKHDSLAVVIDPILNADSILRIINLNPFFTLQVDSTLIYDLQINKPSENYFWYLKNAPIGVKLDKSTGLLYFKAERSYFKSGKLKYDMPYKIELGVQNLRDAKELFESSFTIIFYSTDVIVS